METLPLRPEALNLVERLSESYCFPTVESISLQLEQLSNQKTWALVREATISGPFELLKNETELIDLPGITDRNALRENRYKGILKQVIRDDGKMLRTYMKGVGSLSSSLFLHFGKYSSPAICHHRVKKGVSFHTIIELGFRVYPRYFHSSTSCQ